MPTKKNIGRWPVVLADYSEAVNSRVDPVHKELFMDYANKDMMFYDANTGSYVSFINMIRDGMVDIWKNPVLNYDILISTYPDPDLMTIVPVIDTGIVYMYIGNGNWVPITANSIPLADETTNGLMSFTNFNNLKKLMEYCKIKRYDLGEPVPLPKDREENVLYSICTEVVADPNEVRWVQLDTEVKEYEDGFMRLNFVNPDTGEVDYQIKDPAFIYASSQSQVKPIEITNPDLSTVLYMVQPYTIKVNLEIIENNLVDPKLDWKYNRYICKGTDGQLYDLVDPAFASLDDYALGSVVDDDFTDIYYTRTISS